MNILDEKAFIESVRKLNEKSFKPGERNNPEVLDSHDFRYLKSGEFSANLHIHTNHSDGSMSVKELLYSAKEITEKYNKDFLFAITDHDTIDGTKEALELSKQKEFKNLNITFGVEISTVAIDFLQQKKPLQIHLLVYGIDPFDKRLNEYLKDKRNLKLQLAKDTIKKLNEKLPGYNFNLEEASKCHIMIKKGQDEVAHPLKKYTSGKILLSYYYPNANFSYEEPIKKFKYLFKGQEPYHQIYKKALEMYTQSSLPAIPDEIEQKIQIARTIYLQSHPSIGNMLEAFSSFEEAVDFITTIKSGVMSIAHPARTKAYCPEFYTYLFEKFKKYGHEKALFYEGYYQSYEGRYFIEWSDKIDNAASKFNLLKTGGLDSHGKDLITRCPYT